MKRDHFATITVTSVNAKIKNDKEKNFDKKTLQPQRSKILMEIQTGDFCGAVMGYMMFLEFQRIIERALALHAPIKVSYIRKAKPKFLPKNGYARKQRNNFQELAMIKTIYFVKKKINFS